MGADYGTSYGSRLQLFHGMRADSIVLAIIKADITHFCDNNSVACNV